MFSKSLLKIVGLLFYFQNKNDNIQLLFNVADILYIYIGLVSLHIIESERINNSFD